MKKNNVVDKRLQGMKKKFSEKTSVTKRIHYHLDLIINRHKKHRHFYAKIYKHLGEAYQSTEKYNTKTKNILQKKKVTEVNCFHD